VPAAHLLARDVAVTSEPDDVVEAEIAGQRRRVLICVHPAATLYDPSQGETFERALGRAAEFTDEESGQSRIGDF
jgi:DNA polymerase